jgi:hypothetical protein
VVDFSKHLKGRREAVTVVEQDKDWLDEMRKKASDTREKMGSGGPLPFMKRLNLTGGKAVVKPGGAIVIRLLPRWDIKNAHIKQGDQWVANPSYKKGRPFLPAFEHWWDGEGGTRVRVWCPLTFDPKASPHAICPICEEADRLRNSPNPDDKKFGNSIARSEVFLFNAVMRDPGTKRRALTEEGAPDIRVLCAPPTIYVRLSDIMTGGGDEAFARGDITDIREGHDVMLTRPHGGGDRWQTECAPNKTTLYTPEEADHWRGAWVDCLTNLEEWVKAELKTYKELYKTYHGSDPEEAPASPAAPASAPAAPQATTAPAPKKGKGKAPADPSGFDLPEAATPAAPVPAAQAKGGTPWGLDI